MERDAAKFECNQRFRCDPLWFLCRSTQIPTALLHYCTTALLHYCACAGLRPLCVRSALPNFAVFGSRAVPLRGKAGPASAPGSAVERPARRTPGRSLRDSHQISAAHTPHQQVRSSDCWPPPTSRSSL